MIGASDPAFISLAITALKSENGLLRDYDDHNKKRIADLERDHSARCDQVDALQQRLDEITVAVGGYYCSGDLLVQHIRAKMADLGGAKREIAALQAENERLKEQAGGAATREGAGATNRLGALTPPAPSAWTDGQRNAARRIGAIGYGTDMGRDDPKDELLTDLVRVAHLFAPKRTLTRDEFEKACIACWKKSVGGDEPWHESRALILKAEVSEGLRAALSSIGIEVSP